MADYKFYAFFTASKVGKASISVTCDIYKSSDDSVVVNNQAANEVAGGLYSYTYSSSNADDYIAVFKTADTTVDAQHVPSLVIKQTPIIESMNTAVGVIDGIVDDILVDTGTTLPASISAIATWTAANVLASVTAGTITQIRGNSWAFDITGLTLGAGKKQFTIKRDSSYPDADAILFIDTTTGLLTVNGASVPVADVTKGSIVYAGTTLTVTLHATYSDDMPVGTWKYGIQSLDGAGLVTESYGGDFIVTADMVKAVA